MVLVLAGPFRHRGARVCADRIGDVVRRHCERVRVQGRRRLGAPVYYQRPRLWRVALLTRRHGLVDAC